MSEKKKAELTAHYCPNIDDNVFVMSTVDKSGAQKRKCLSAHLCRSDERASCGRTDEAHDGDGTGITI